MESTLESIHGPLADLLDWSVDHPTLSTVVIMTAGTLKWYAMPDFVRSRPLRVLAKTAIAGVMVATLAHVHGARHADLVNEEAELADLAPQTDGLPTDLSTHARDRKSEVLGLEDLDELTRTPGGVAVLTAAGATTVGLAVAVSVFAEKWLFSRGERRRAEGRALAHTRQAIALASLAAVSEAFGVFGSQTTD